MHLLRGTPKLATDWVPDKVAAVCYRFTGPGIEFLLVRTKSGKWTFPKGNIEPHLSRSESAELEAYEEAGALGCVAPRHFGWYYHQKGTFGGSKRADIVVAHLMKVEQIIPPMETYRQPSWFDSLEAKRKLGQCRAPEMHRELSRVVDMALGLLRRNPGRTPFPRILPRYERLAGRM